MTPLASELEEKRLEAKRDVSLSFQHSDGIVVFVTLKHERKSVVVSRIACFERNTFPCTNSSSTTEKIEVIEKGFHLQPVILLLQKRQKTKVRRESYSEKKGRVES